MALWPRSLFGRLIAAGVIAVVLAQATSLYLYARDRERFVVDSYVRDWSRHISGLTQYLEQLPPPKRAAMMARLRADFTRLSPPWPARRPHSHRRMSHSSPLLLPPPPAADAGSATTHPWVVLHPRWQPPRAPVRPGIYLPLPFTSDVPKVLETRLHTDLGNGFGVRVTPADGRTVGVIPIPSPFFDIQDGRPTRSYDVQVRLPDGTALVYRVTRESPGTPLPRGLLANLVLLLVILIIALFVATRGITRPLSRLAKAADELGRSVRQPKLPENGARELRRAARAFNTMQDRLRRYLDSRTRVLAAMSHDLKTPLTRLRLQVETQIEDPALQRRFGRELDEMETMVRGALALFRGLNDEEVAEPIDVNALLETVRAEFVEMGAQVTVEGRALAPFTGKPQGLKRCITNLIANAVKFGNGAQIQIQDGATLAILIRDQGPGIPPEEIEKVFEPFYRVESSRNRDTGGTGLGLSIARDVAEANGGSLTLRNLPQGGLEARLTLPRGR